MQTALIVLSPSPKEYKYSLPHDQIAYGSWELTEVASSSKRESSLNIQEAYVTGWMNEF